VRGPVSLTTLGMPQRTKFRVFSWEAGIGGVGGPGVGPMGTGGCEGSTDGPGGQPGAPGTSRGGCTGGVGALGGLGMPGPDNPSSCGGGFGGTYGGIIGGMNPTPMGGWRGPVDPMPMDNSGVMGAPGGMGLMGMPGGGVTDPPPEDVGIGWGGGPRGPYSPVQPGQPYTDPSPEQSGGSCGTGFGECLLQTVHNFSTHMSNAALVKGFGVALAPWYSVDRGVHGCCWAPFTKPLLRTCFEVVEMRGLGWLGPGVHQAVVW
jgi:hypothetical protein